MSPKTIIVPPEERQHDEEMPQAGREEQPTGVIESFPVVPGYNILGHAASGGMGVVYAATQLETDRKVALKLVRPERHNPAAAERILREIRALSALTHPGIVEYVDHGVTEYGVPYLAMEWLDGIDLETRLHDGPLSLEDTLALAIRVAEALAVAHEHGVIHRDIKPANIFLVGGRPEDARLLDFGVAQLGERTWTLTLPGRIIGTPTYMSPEQATAAELDPRADLFSLGCVLHECLCGEPAFSGEQLMAVLAKILMESPPRIGELVPGIPSTLDEIIAKLLEKNREHRIGRAQELAQRLRSLVAGQSEPFAAVAEALTREEQVLRSVLFFCGRAEPGTPPVDLAALASEHLGYHVILADATGLIVLDRGGVASDQAATAARCALALRERAPHLAIAVASGQGLVTRRSLMGQVLDRGAELLLRSTPGHIRIDDVTASLLDAGFVVGDDDGLTLLAVRDVQPGARRLMGKTTPLVGRSKELAFLEAAFEECVQARCATAIVVIADAGVGKSRLRHEFDDRVRARHGPAVTTLISRADPMRAQAPFAMMARAVHEAAGLADGESVRVRLRKLRARISRHVAREDVERVALYLGELVSAFPNDAPIELQLAREDSATMRSRIQAAWCTWLRAESDANPVLFVLEDLHWADAATVQVMDAALEELEGSSMLVLALARPTVHQRFPSLWRQREVQLLDLPPLPLRAARMLVHQVLGDAVEPADVERIVNGARGNAFFLEELIRAVGGSRAGDELPDSVLGMMQARLAALPARERQVLRAASVFGPTAWRGGVRELLGPEAPVAELGPTLARLVEAEWLIHHPRSQIPCEDEYSFRHALVCDAAYATLTDADRRVGHRLAGRWLEQAEGQEAVVLAEHFQRGEDHDKATTWFAIAVDQASERHELDVVLQLVVRGLKHSVPGESRGRLLQRRAEVCAGTGHHHEAAEAALAALEELPSDSSRWYAAAGEAALAMGRAGRAAHVIEFVDRLVKLEPAGVDGAINFVTVARAAVPLAVAGEATTAMRLLDKIIQVTSVMGDEDPEIVGHMHAAQALRAVVTGDPGMAYQEMEAAIAAFGGAGSLRNELEHSVGAGFFLLELGCIERAEAILRRTIERSAELRLDHLCAVARHNLGRRIGEAGRVEDGLELERQALVSFERHGNQRMLGLTRCHVAWILLQDGRADEAMPHADMAVELLERHAASLSIARATRARICLAVGAVEHALGDAKAAIDGLEALDRVQEGESLIRLTWAEALAAAGRADEALAAILAAQRSLEERALRIDSEELRTSFSSRVPENARIVRLAREWLERRS
jgi:tetratricopeptide (TPR) repeat protein